MKSLLAAGALPGCVGVAAIAASLSGPGMTAPTPEAPTPVAPLVSSSPVASVMRSAAMSLFGDDIIAIEDPEAGFCMIFAPGTSEEYMQKRMDMLRESSLRFEANDRWGGIFNSGPVALTYSFPGDGTTLTSGNPGLNQMFALWNDAFDGLGGEAVWKQKFRESFNAWQAVTGNIYTEVSDDDAPWPGSDGPFNGQSGRGDIRIVSSPQDGAGGVLAFNFFPDTGDMHLDAADLTANNLANPNNNFRFLRNVVIHENGHGMGLSHSCPVQGTKLMEPFINTGFDGPQIDDVLGMQILYGDRFEPNDSAAGATPTGKTGIFADTTTGLGNLSIDASTDADVFRVTVSGESTLAVTVSPLAATYLAGAQTGAGCPVPLGGFPTVNIGDNANLRIEILNSAGQQIGLRDSNGLGLGESLPSFTLPEAGDFSVRITGSQWTDIQPYAMTVTLTGGGCPGDLNTNGSVNGSDLGILLGAWGDASTFPPADLNGDGQINGADLGLLLGCWTG